MPEGDAGALIGISDRLDTIVGIAGIGKKPTGAADQFGLRRACLAIINIILAKKYRLSLSDMVSRSISLLQPKLSLVKQKQGEPPVKEWVLDFFRGRLEALWKEKHRTDVVQAVLAAGFDDLVAAELRLTALSAIVGRPDFAPLASAFKRVGNIVQKQGADIAKGSVDPAKLQDEAEKQLHAAYGEAKEQVAKLVGADDYAQALQKITALKPAVDLFFDKVMVMAEDRALRENRIRLLVEVGSLFNRVADFSKIQAET